LEATTASVRSATSGSPLMDATVQVSEGKKWHQARISDDLL
jgi:hypothetical protein